MNREFKEDEEKQSFQDDLVDENSGNLTIPPPIRLNGEIAYVQQSPWIQNLTIRDNILSGLPLDKARYVDVIRICELERDLEILPAGDLTEIGEKGINLSGGQKARVSLARAVYSDRDIFLMDDPISALDANVRKKIIENLILRYLKQKTRVLVTHAIDFIHLADKIMILDKGYVAAYGTFEELKENELLQKQMKVNKINTATAAAKKQEAVGTETSEILVEEYDGEHRQTIAKAAMINTLATDSRSTVSAPSESLEEKLKAFEKMGRVTSENDGKIIKDENEEVINVEMSSYFKLLKYSKGYGMLFLLNIVMLGFTLCKIKTDYTIGLWAKDTTVQHDKFVQFTVTVFAYATSAAMFMLFRCLVIFTMGISASKVVHQKMICSVLKAPINLFYDVTPTGTILNRFSKDLQVLDNNVALAFSTINVMLYQVLSILIVISLTNYYIIILIPFMAALAYSLFGYALPSYREGTRIESITKSSLLNNINETVSGCSTIRAFNRQ